MIVLITPNQVADLLTVLCIFLLRVSVAYAVMWVLAKLSNSARMRFIIWLSFLLTSTLYWLFCLESFVVRQPRSAIVANAGSGFLNITVPSGSVSSIATVLNLALGCYVLVLLGLGIARIIARWKLAIALRHKVAPSEITASVFQGLAQAIGAPRCEFWLMPGLPSPASFGWLKPAVYLPADEAAAEDRKLHDVFWHELTHIRRRDSLWDSLARLARALLWFHPLIHRAVAAMRLERELVCDVSVIRQDPSKRHEYANTLVHFGWRSSVAGEPDYMNLGLAAQAAVLSKRVRLILDGEPSTSIPSKALRSFLGTATLWAFATAIPMMWMSFGLKIPVLRAGPSIVHALYHAAARPVRSSRHINHRDTVLVEPPQTTAVMLAPASESIAAQHTGTHPHSTLMPSADAPLFDHSDSGQVADGRDGQGSRGSTTALPGQTSLPTKSSVLVDAAEQLGQLSMGHGDHDHD